MKSLLAFALFTLAAAAGHAGPIGGEYTRRVVVPAHSNVTYDVRCKHDVAVVGYCSPNDEMVGMSIKENTQHNGAMVLGHNCTVIWKHDGDDEYTLHLVLSNCRFDAKKPIPVTVVVMEWKMPRKENRP